MKSVGPNATLVEDNVEAVIRGLKAQLVGEIEVGGPDLARSLTDLGLIAARLLRGRFVFMHSRQHCRWSDFLTARPLMRLATNCAPLCRCDE